MGKGTRVTCLDLETGESESKELLNDWMLVVDGRAFLHHVQRYANGTVILTVKIAAPDDVQLIADALAQDNGTRIPLDDVKRNLGIE